MQPSSWFPNTLSPSSNKFKAACKQKVSSELDSQRNSELGGTPWPLENALSAVVYADEVSKMVCACVYEGPAGIRMKPFDMHTPS